MRTARRREAGDERVRSALSCVALARDRNRSGVARQRFRRARARRADRRDAAGRGRRGRAGRPPAAGDHRRGGRHVLAVPERIGRRAARADRIVRRAGDLVLPRARGVRRARATRRAAPLRRARACVADPERAVLDGRGAVFGGDGAARRGYRSVALRDRRARHQRARDRACAARALRTQFVSRPRARFSRSAFQGRGRRLGARRAGARVRAVPPGESARSARLRGRTVRFRVLPQRADLFRPGRAGSRGAHR
ncbi:Uncharacterised protein [Burkholderia pseudomallei]|nr:Uncharacterised protein [Burkholderia pseudomallei]CAJ4557814.1 Uncharacterised protein [Burkholderia pseudomallei]VCD34665.1 Uncharacterised protein [Burkholderia pseudomallei]VCN17904.1 Uncharacterised protein [Burkholderia pseudomallei]VCN21394.1 Uncharacterised protein [Burkholderia pseudomallei]